MSDTPRTDAVKLSLGHLHGEVCWWCEAEFARTLERELREVTKERDKLGESRVPQYDVELKMAHAALADWQQVARKLYLTASLRNYELRKVVAMNAYSKLAKDYNL